MTIDLESPLCDSVLLDPMYPEPDNIWQNSNQELIYSKRPLLHNQSGYIFK